MSESVSYHNIEIDNEILIQEVKERPALYNRASKEYSDVALKKVLWEEIGAKIYGDVWDAMTEYQRRAKSMEVLKRWSNLRTCFSRELKIMRDPLFHKRRKYIYFDKLLFLLDEIHPTSISNTETENTYIYTNTSIDFEEETEEETPKKTPKKVEEPQSSCEKVTKKKKKNVKEYVKSSIDKLREELTDNDRTKGYEVEEFGPKTFETDPETNFALSIVPMLKMIASDKKIDAHIEILSILKKYTMKNRINNECVQVKIERDEEDETSDDNSEVLSAYYQHKE